MESKRIVYLQFISEGKRKTSITISDPKPGLTMADAERVANILLQQNVIEVGDKDRLAVFDTAAEVVTTTTPLP